MQRIILKILIKNKTMAKCRTYFASASSSLKYATCFWLFVLVFHIIAFSTPNWTTVRLSVNENTSRLWIAGSDHGGLWQICSCISAYGDEFCSCFGRHGEPGDVTVKVQSYMFYTYIISIIISMYHIKLLITCIVLIDMSL